MNKRPNSLHSPGSDFGNSDEFKYMDDSSPESGLLTPVDIPDVEKIVEEATNDIPAMVHDIIDSVQTRDVVEHWKVLTTTKPFVCTKEQRERARKSNVTMDSSPMTVIPEVFPLTPPVIREKKYSVHNEIEVQEIVSRYSDVYKMDHPNEGKVIIFNHENYGKHLNLKQRLGTAQDVINIKNTMEPLGFTVEVHEDFTTADTLKELDKLQSYDFTDDNCLIMFILSHGLKDYIHTNDSMTPISTYFDKFKADVCPSLAGKPKIFFIQACRGEKIDIGVNVRMGRTQMDSSTSAYKIPVSADFLTVHSSVLEYVSFINTTDGSWFIQTLCDVIRKYHMTKDLLSMLTITNRIVALNYLSDSEISCEDNLTQVPAFTSTLTRDVFLKPKN